MEALTYNYMFSSYRVEKKDSIQMFFCFLINSQIRYIFSKREHSLFWENQRGILKNGLQIYKFEAASVDLFMLM